MNSNYLFNRSYSKRNKQVIQAWGNFIEKQEWSFFCTFTTFYKLSLNGARIKIQRMHQYLHTKFGINSSIFWVAETFTNGGYHIHCLIRFEKNQTDKAPVHKAWEKVSGTLLKENCNECKIENYEKGKGANFYTVKHLQRNDVDYDII